MRLPRLFPVGAKLAAATVSTLLLGTVLVYVGLTRYERESLLRAKEASTAMTLELFVQAISAPVVFDDPTGIEETISFLARNEEVGAIVLRATRDGEQVELGRFAREGWTPSTGAAEPGIVRHDDRLVARESVRDTQGAIIAEAVVEMSLARENAAFEVLSQRILAIAAAAALLLVALLLFVSRIAIVRPLSRLVSAAHALERGERTHGAVVTSRDEIGELAQAFSHMSDAIARREQEIADRNADMRTVLDNVGQGFLAIDREGRVAAERSRVVEAWLGNIGEGETLRAVLGRIDENLGLSFEAGWESVLEDFLPLELCLKQLPSRFRIAARHFRIEYRPLMKGEQIDKTVVVLSDVTADVEREHAEREQRDLASAVGRLVADRAGFADFVREASGLVARIAGGADRVLLLRDVHTLKGITGIFGVSAVAAACDALETRAAESDGAPHEDDIAAVVQAWTRFSQSVPSLDGERERAPIEISQDEHGEFVRALQAGAPRAELLATASSWLLEPVETRLRRLGEQASTVARRVGKPAPAVVVDARGVRASSERLAELWSSLVHVVRNAVDHGLESAETRVAAGKREAGTLRLVARDDQGAMTITIGDDGKGVDWTRVRAKAAARGLPHASHEDLVAALFADGVSTRDEANDVSGRGVGLAAVAASCHALGGRVLVESRAGEGTEMRFVVPAPGGERVGRRLRTSAPPPMLS